MMMKKLLPMGNEGGIHTRKGAELPVDEDRRRRS